METLSNKRVQQFEIGDNLATDLLNMKQTKRGREVVTDEDVAEVKDIVDEWLAGEDEEFPFSSATNRDPLRVGGNRCKA